MSRQAQELPDTTLVESIKDSIRKRNYEDLEKKSEEFLKSNEWDLLVRHIASVRPQGKARDALISLLRLEGIAGLDANVPQEFIDLDGSSLSQLRSAASGHAMELLSKQIEDKHTYFLDIEGMSRSQFAVLVKDVIEARQREFEQLKGNLSRVAALGTYYGFMILATGGSQPHDSGKNTHRGWRYYGWRRGSWLDEQITEESANAIQKLAAELGGRAQMNREYQTLGGKGVFKKRCSTFTTAKLLENIVRLSLYKMPGSRTRAARELGKTGDSRALPYMHHRLTIDPNRGVRQAIGEALGTIGDPLSIAPLKETIRSLKRVRESDLVYVSALGQIHSQKTFEALLDLISSGQNMVIARAIRLLRDYDYELDFVKVLAPLVSHSSKPILREVVIALSDIEEGRSVLSTNAFMLFKKLLNDRLSRKAVIRILETDAAGAKPEIQEVVAKNIRRLLNLESRYSKVSQSGSYYSHWYTKSHQRILEELSEIVSMACKYMEPPFVQELLEFTAKGLEVLRLNNREPDGVRRSILVMAIDKQFYLTEGFA